MKTDNEMKTDKEMKQFIKNNLIFAYPAVKKILKDKNYLKEKYELMKAVVDGFDEKIEINKETKKEYVKFSIIFLPQNLKKKAKEYETLDDYHLQLLCEEIQKYIDDFADDLDDKINDEAFDIGATIIALENGFFYLDLDDIKDTKARISKILSSIDTFIEYGIENKKRLEFEKNQENKIKSINERTNEAVQKFNKATGENLELVEMNGVKLLTIPSND